MRIWLLQASEILPINGNTRLLRMGLLGEELSKNKDNDVTWFSSTFDHFKKEQLFKKDTIIDIKDNYHLHLFYALGYKRNISISRIINHKLLGNKLKKQMKKEEKPDIILASFPTIEFALYAVEYGKKNHIPVIIDVRDLWPDIFNHNLSGIIKLCAKPYIKYLDYQTKKILKNAYKVTGTSSLMVDWGLKKGHREKTRLDKPFFLGYQRSNLEIDKNSFQLDNNFNICFFATINNQFNYDLLCDIGKSLEKENVDIIVCGNGPNFEELKTKCENIHNIKLMGWCSGDALRSILKNADIGLAPYKDTFDFNMSISNKFCEYLSNGLPVIITCNGLMKELIEKNKVGLASMDVNKIKEFVVYLRNHQNEWRKMSNNASSLYNKYFDAEKIYPEMVKYLMDVRKEYKK